METFLWLFFILLSIFSFFILLIYFFTFTILYGNKDFVTEWENPRDLGIPYEECVFTSIDNVKIHSWYIEKKKKGPTIILVHGRGSHKKKKIPYISFLYEAGFNLFLLDLRNSGESRTKNTYTTLGYYEQEDIRFAVDYLAQRKQIKKIGIWGFSMGGASSILAMAKEKRILAGIFEGSYIDVWSILTYTAKNKYKMPSSFLLPFVFWLIDKKIGIQLKEVSPLQEISKISPRPIFIIHGDQDTTVPVEHGEKLYKKAGKNAILWKPKGVKHVNALEQKSKETKKKVLDFLTKNLR